MNLLHIPLRSEEQWCYNQKSPTGHKIVINLKFHNDFNETVSIFQVPVIGKIFIVVNIIIPQCRVQLL